MPPNGMKRQKDDHAKRNKEIIHSGHFMVSDIEDPEVQDGEDNPSLAVHESDCDQESLPIPERGYDFESACKETSRTYTFGARSSHSLSIDASLTKLFECMTLAYSGKLTSPRWKQFKGLKLRLKEKIRLNNMIWRAWHMQFVMRMKTPVCQFATPLDSETHMKPEAVLVEGTYWKRKKDNITAEYKKWRLFYRDRFRPKPSQDNENVAMDLDTRWPSWPKESYPGLQHNMDEDFIMDFSDTLFSTLNSNQPFDFPNPREIAAKAGIADFIQPGLVQLQPSVDDFMDTLEPLADLFTDFLNSKLPTLPEESSDTSNAMQDVLPSVPDEQVLYGSNTSAPSNTFFQPQAPSNMLMKQQQAISPRLLDQTNIEPIPQKSMVMDVNCSSGPNTTLNTPLLPMNQSIIPPFANNSLEVILQQSKPVQQRKVECKKTFYQRPAFHSASFDESQTSQIAPSVPLQSIPQGQIAGNITASVNSNKNETQPLFFSLNLAPMNQGIQQTQVIENPVNFKVPTQVTGFGSPLILPTHIMKTAVTATTTTESPAFRRHSYTTGQVQSSGDYMGSRRSRLIAPATTTASFAVPELPSRQRTRSRSVSSPQSGSPKPFLQQPAQAISLTDISCTLPTGIFQTETLGKKTAISNIAAPTANVTSANILPQNAVLAQLLSSGCSQEMGQAVVKMTSTTTPSVTTPITIIRPVPALVSTTAHTLVFSPVPMASSSSMSDLQRNLIVGATNPTFVNPNSPPMRTAPSPESPGSSTCSSSPVISNASFDSPQASTSKMGKQKTAEEKVQYKEHRRVCHINAEQKRRCNIKNGFEALHNLLPNVGHAPNSKVSKAAMLQRGAEYIRVLKTERQQQQDEAEMLKKKIEELNQAISMYQSQLPASGAPVPCQRTNKMKEMFEEYVRQQTLQNWKFWIFSLILGPLVESFNNNVSTASMDEMYKSILTWLEQHCSLVALRPGVLNSLRHLSTTTNILTDPSRLPEEATQAVTKKENHQSKPQ